MNCAINLMRWIGIVISLSLSLSSFAGVPIRPTLNPTPKHFFTLQGRIDPSLKGKVNLVFVQKYAGMSATCTQNLNTFEGIEGQPTQEVVFVPRPNAQGHYVLPIPLDRYLQGRCDWQPYSFGFRFSKKANADTEVFIDYGKKTKDNPSVYSLVCQDTVASCHVVIPKGSYASFSISGKTSSTLEFNLLKKKVK